MKGRGDGGAAAAAASSGGGGGGGDNNNAQQGAFTFGSALQATQSEREQVLTEYRNKIREHREVEARLKRMRQDVKGLQARYQKTEGNKIREHREVEARLKRMRQDVKGLQARYQKTEDDLTALQSVGQIIGDVLKRLDTERFIVKASSGPRYVVGCGTDSSTLAEPVQTGCNRVKDVRRDEGALSVQAKSLG
jgi:ATP-dependent 26S proteasome regulatory subunit